MRRFYWVCFLLSFLSACDESEDATIISELTVSFRQSTQNIAESRTADVVILEFDQPADIDGSIAIQVTEFNARKGENYSTSPGASDDLILNVAVQAGSSQSTIVVAPIPDSDSFIDSLQFTIVTENAGPIRVGNNPSIKIFLTESSSSGNDDGTTTGTGNCQGSSFDVGTVGCAPSQSTDALEVVTWNIENFPLNTNTVASVIDIIRDFNADIYALQEIKSQSAFSTVVNSLSGYDGLFVNVNGSIEHAFIYKTSEITSISVPKLLFPGLRSPFPREPVEVDITHANGLAVKLINIHLKCCGGSDNESRRADASVRLKEYVDENYSDEPVIILGDWNEDFDIGSSFTNFLEDTDNYLFADLPIYEGSGADYSYPCTGASFCPSHIDHILVTNELCDNLSESFTVRLDDCVSGYLSNVSDHRPMMVRLQADE